MWFNSSLVFHWKLCRSLVRTGFLCFQNASKTIENFNKRYEDNVELCMESGMVYGTITRVAPFFSASYFGLLLTGINLSEIIPEMLNFGQIVFHNNV